MRSHDIIHELEAEYGVELDANFDAGVDGLCDDITCRHSECECWGRFRTAAQQQLEKQAAEMRLNPSERWARDLRGNPQYMVCDICGLAECGHEDNHPMTRAEFVRNVHERLAENAE